MGVENICRMCHGSGQVPTGSGRRSDTKTCPNCEGDGYIGFTHSAGVCAFFCPVMKGTQ